MNDSISKFKIVYIAIVVAASMYLLAPFAQAISQNDYEELKKKIDQVQAHDPELAKKMEEELSLAIKNREIVIDEVEEDVHEEDLRDLDDVETDDLDDEVGGGVDVADAISEADGGLDDGGNNFNDSQNSDQGDD